MFTERLRLLALLGNVNITSIERIFTYTHSACFASLIKLSLRNASIAEQSETHMVRACLHCRRKGIYFFFLEEQSPFGLLLFSQVLLASFKLFF